MICGVPFLSHDGLRTSHFRRPAVFGLPVHDLPQRVQNLDYLGDVRFVGPREIILPLGVLLRLELLT